MPPKARILCTEGDADSREMLAMILRMLGYYVDSTESPLEAIQFAHSRFYDLI